MVGLENKMVLSGNLSHSIHSANKSIRAERKITEIAIPGHMRKYQMLNSIM